VLKLSKSTGFIFPREKVPKYILQTMRVGLNALANRFFYLNDKFPLLLLNKNIVQYKIACKKKEFFHLINQSRI
jgi:hypothetical protein